MFDCGSVSRRAAIGFEVDKVGLERGAGWGADDYDSVEDAGDDLAP